jgi:hypothetical protein
VPSSCALRKRIFTDSAAVAVAAAVVDENQTEQRTAAGDRYDVAVLVGSGYSGRRTPPPIGVTASNRPADERAQRRRIGACFAWYFAVVVCIRFASVSTVIRQSHSRQVMTIR